MVVPRKYDKWVVDYRCCSLETLENDLAARVKWGSCQHPVVWGYDKITGEERQLVDSNALSLAFSEWWSERRLFLSVDVEDKPGLVSNSSVTELVMSNLVTENVIDWDSLEIAPIVEDEIGVAMAVMDEDAMYAFVGLRAEDESAAEKDKERTPAPGMVDVALEEADVPVSDMISGEAAIFYDREDPPMTVGSTYATMDEFRSAVRQHAIKGQFELGTQSSDRDRFRGYCTAEGCPWAIVARLMHDRKSVRVLTASFAYLCNL